MDKAAAPVTAGLDYYQRREEGQSKLKSATGAASTTAGMIAGTKAGAALGSVAGPVGTVVGGLAGAVGGAYLGGKAHDVVADTIEKSPSISQPKYEMPKPSSETGPYKTSDEDMEKLGVKKKVNESFLKILRGTK
jgi:phage tail tape-measure protein